MRSLRSVTVLLLVTLAACTSEGTEPSNSNNQPERPPNVLIIVTDDQRFIGTMGVMPAASRIFAEGGTRFPNSYTTTPLCCPARATIFTGLYAHNHRVRRGNEPLKLDQGTTVQRYLRDAGYRTGMFGKYLNFWPLERNPPHFDEWAIFANSSEDGYYDGTWNVGGRSRRVERYGNTFLTKRALEFLKRADRRDDDQPWLAYLSVAAPHNPRTPERKYAGARVPRWNPNAAVLESDLGDKPNFQSNYDVTKRGTDPLEAARADYLRTLMSVDDMVAKVFRTLRRRGEADDTIAFLVSDNGFHFGENGRFGKTVPYRMSIAVPLYLRWPGHVQEGGIDRRLSALTDLGPTIAEATGVDLPEMDGLSLLSDSRRDELLIENWQAVHAWTALVQDKPPVHYIEYYEDDGETVVAQEYYELESDPWELSNLLGDDDASNDPDPEELEAVRERLTRYRSCAGAECP